MEGMHFVMKVNYTKENKNIEDREYFCQLVSNIERGNYIKNFK